MARVIPQTARAWGAATLALGIAAAGLSSATSGSVVTSSTRMALAAGVISAYTATIGLLATDRSRRTLPLCLLWGGAVPALVGLLNAILVATVAGAAPAALSALPWLAGLVVSLAGLRLPTLRLPRREHRG